MILCKPLWAGHRKGYVAVDKASRQGLSCDLHSWRQSSPRCSPDHRPIMEDRQAQGSTETLETGDSHISMDEPAIFRKSLQTWRLKVTEGTIPL